MKRITSFFTGGLLLLALVAGVAEAQTTTVTGKVVSKTGDTLVIMTEDGRQMTFRTSSAAVPTTIVVDSPIEVRYSTLDDGTYELDTVTLRSDASTTTAQNQTYQTQTNQYDDDALPATASPVPVLALLGLAGLGAGLLLRRTASHSRN